MNGASMLVQYASRLEATHTVEVIDTFKAIEDIASEWRALALKEYPGHPFADPDWIICWLECFAREKDIRVIVVRSGDGISGIVPLVLTREKYYGIVVRRLGLPYNAHSPRCDVLVPSHDPTVYDTVLDCIKAWSGEWDVFELPLVPADGSGYELVRKCTTQSQILSGEWFGLFSPYLAMEGSWDNYYNQVPRKRRAKHRNRRRRLEEHGIVDFEMISEEDDLDLCLEEGYRIEAAAWKGVNGTAIQSSPEVRSFYTKLAHRMAKRGCLRLCFLRVGGRRIAFTYMLEFNKKIFAMKKGYEPEFRLMSPSTMLVIETLKYAFENGIKEYDFLGVVDPWKLEWANQLREHRWILAFSGSAKSRAIHSIKSTILPWYKRVRTVCRSISEKAV